MMGDESSPMQRKFRRVPCQEPARMSVRNGSVYGPYETVIRDLSQGGALLEVHGEKGLMLPFGLFNLSISVTDGPLVGAEWNGNIVHLLPGEKKIGIGMQFATLSVEEESRLVQFIDHL
jgi:hypothetical protein